MVRREEKRVAVKGQNGEERKRWEAAKEAVKEVEWKERGGGGKRWRREEERWRGEKSERWEESKQFGSGQVVQLKTAMPILHIH